jgi:hypothetical protein
LAYLHLALEQVAAVAEEGEHEDAKDDDEHGTDSA